MDLIKLLTDQLGIQDNQARGGVGLIFDLVKKKLGDKEFAQVSNLVPQAQSWMGEAPKTDDAGGGLLGMAGSLASKFGFDDLGKLAGLAAGFKKLGLDADMITKFIPVVMKYAESLGGDNLKAILAKVLTK